MSHFKSMKLQISTATLLAACVAGHGYVEIQDVEEVVILQQSNGFEEFFEMNFDRLVPRSHIFQNQFDYPMSMPFPNAAESRVGDEHFLACTTSAGQSGRQHGTGECVEIDEVCPLASFWSTVGDPRDSQWCDPSRQDIRLGCCAGYRETVAPMSSFEHEMSNGQKTACWAGNTGIPTSLDSTGLPTFNGNAALHVDNLKPRATYTAGEEFDLTWVATAQHGGTVEVGLVCDGDESYENFARNRMEHVGGQMYKTQAGTDTPADMILSQGGESCPTWAWSHSEYARFTHRLRIPENAEGKCVFGWFWWGLQSHGVFVQCMDVTVLPSSGTRNPSCVSLSSRSDQLLGADGETDNDDGLPVWVIILLIIFGLIILALAVGLIVFCNKKNEGSISRNASPTATEVGSSASADPARRSSRYAAKFEPSSASGAPSKGDAEFAAQV